jgi:hypothetical protein
VTAAPETVAPEPVTAAPEPTSEIDPVVLAKTSEGERTAGTIEPKQGFFARLFKRRKVAEVQAEPAAEPIAQTQPEAEPSVELHALALPEPVYPDPPPKPAEPHEPAEPVEPHEPAEPGADLAAELAELEAQIQQESTDLLTGVLDRLGAAHHRPFSRA